MRKHIIRLIVTPIFIIVLSGSTTFATTWFVEQNGSGDFTVIQDAVDIAAPGDTIAIGPGWYQAYQETTWPPTRIYVDVSEKESLSLIGTGTSTTIIGPPVVDSDVNRRNYGIIGTNVMSSLMVKDLKIRNMNWKGALVSNGVIKFFNCVFIDCDYGIDVSTEDGGLIEGCVFEDCSHNGISVDYPTTGMVIQNCHIIDCYWGSGLRWAAINDCEALNCTVTGGEFGIKVSYHSTGLIRDCYFDGQEYACIYIDNCGIVQLENNWLEHIGSGHWRSAAISFYDSSTVHGEGNTIISQERCFSFGGGIPSLDLRNNHILRGNTEAWYAEVSALPLPEDRHIDLGNNYWGTDDPHEISTWIYDAYDSDEISIWVDFMPILTEPVVDVQSPSPIPADYIKVWPNPFNPQTVVSFALERNSHVVVNVFDVSGRLVAGLANREYPAGQQTLKWTGRDSQGRAMPSGTYIVRLETDTGVEARKVMLIR